jgi:uncharacterized membrane protein HdeD (DUF308 family)
MNTLVAQRLSKWKLVGGRLTTIVGVMVLAWPGPSTLRHYGDGYSVLLLSLWIGIGFIFQDMSGIAAGIR